MFGRKHDRRRSPNILFVIFRLFLSVVMFALLLGGLYSAYKHFSGLDPLKLDPQAVLKNILSSRSPQQLAAALSSLKINTSLINQEKKVAGQSFKSATQPNTQPNTSNNYIFRFMLLADSHNDNGNLAKAVSQVKLTYPDVKFIIGLGDYTEVGTVEELKNAKTELDSAGLRYFLVAGDHDLWDSRDKQTDPATNFREVFGLTYQSFTYTNYRFALLHNSDNYKGMSDEQLRWLTDQLQLAKDEASSILVFVHQPLYHPSSDHVMGRVEPHLKSQAKGLIYQLKEAGVKKVFAGDTHYFSEYEEPETKLSMVTVGAMVQERNPQAPRFAIVYVFEDGSIKVEDVQIK